MNFICNYRWKLIKYYLKEEKECSTYLRNQNCKFITDIEAYLQDVQLFQEHQEVLGHPKINI